MKSFVAITDNDWFRFLRNRPHIDEVNFWQPSGRRSFRALEPGQPFLFKLHAPEHFIVGGGFFTHFSLYPARLAWNAFGEKNGASSWEEMCRRIEKYRKSTPDPRADYQVGCILLGSPFFLKDEEWIEVPKDFHRNIVQGKTYDLTVSPGRELWERVELRLRTEKPFHAEIADGSLFGSPVVIRPRLGQGGFRVLVADTYERRCAVTSGKVLPALEAAHIKPVHAGGQHRIDNGILLRSDIHTLYDQGYVSVTKKYKFLVSKKVKTDFHNGEEYYRYQGESLWTPAEQSARPAREFLEWHEDTVFRG